MRIPALIAISCIVVASLAQAEDPVLRDIEQLQRIGDAFVAGGVATESDVSGWHQALRLTISSMLPGEARDIAQAICGRKLGLSKPWAIEVYLVVGERPAGKCNAQ